MKDNAAIHANKETKTINSNAIADKPKEEEEEERYSCWCFVSVDGTRFDAKILHKEESQNSK
jgi:hypothetical protein